MKTYEKPVINVQTVTANECLMGDDDTCESLMLEDKFNPGVPSSARGGSSVTCVFTNKNSGV